MLKKYYLGIDGGGTKTKVSIIDDQLNLIYEGIGGPSSTDTVDEMTTLNNISSTLDAFKGSVSYECVFCGIGGVLTHEDFKHVERMLKNLKGVTHNTKIIVRNDMENALASGKLFKEGIVLIAGTGMVAYGKDAFGKTYKSGGWGYEEGDFGSAYDMGYQAIRMAIKSLDGRLDASPFIEEIKTRLNLYTQADIVPTIHAYKHRRTDVANLAKIVTKHADKKDIHAEHIISQATNDLANAVYAVNHHIDLEQKCMVIVGTLGNSGGQFQKMLHDKILKKLPDMKILEPLIDPSFAAAILATLQK